MSQVLEYERAMIRHDSGEIRDKGNWGVDPTHYDFSWWTDIGNGSSDARDAFARADVHAQLYALRIVPAPGIYRIASNLTLTSSCALNPGVRLKPASGVTVTVNGPLAVDAHQCFDTSLGGTITLGGGATERVYVEWWGAVGDGATDDKSAIQAAINALPSGGGTIRLRHRSYGIASGLVIDRAGTVFDGDSGGLYTSDQVVGLKALTGFTGDAMLEIGVTSGSSSRHNIILRRLNLWGNALSGSFDGIRDYRGNNAFVMEDVVVNDVPGIGFYAPETEVSPNDGQLVHGYFRNIKCRSCGTGARFYKCNAVDVAGWSINGSTNVGLEIIRGNGQSWSGLSVEGSGKQGIYIDALSGADRVQGITLVGPRLEGNNTLGTTTGAIYVGVRARGVTITSPYLFSDAVGIYCDGEGVTVTAPHFNSLSVYGLEVGASANDVQLIGYDADAIGSGAAYGGAGSVGELVVIQSGNIEQVQQILPGANVSVNLAGATNGRGARITTFAKEASLVDVTPTTVFTVTHTANGVYGFEALLLISDRASGSTNSSAKVMKVAFVIVRDSGGSVARSAVTEVYETASAAVTGAQSDIGAVTVTLNAVSADVTEVQVDADVTGAAAHVLKASGEITQVYSLTTQAVAS